MPADAAAYLLRSLTLWRAVFLAKRNGVKHVWISVGGKGPLLNQGVTLCGQILLPTFKLDWENIYIKRRCPTCDRKLALVRRVAERRL